MAELKIKAVEMTRQIRDKIYLRVKDMTPTEELAFYREQARLMNEKAAKLRKRKRKPTPA